MKQLNIHLRQDLPKVYYSNISVFITHTLYRHTNIMLSYNTIDLIDKPSIHLGHPLHQMLLTFKSNFTRIGDYT